MRVVPRSCDLFHSGQESGTIREPRETPELHSTFLVENDRTEDNNTDCHFRRRKNRRSSSPESHSSFFKSTTPFTELEQPLPAVPISLPTPPAMADPTWPVTLETNTIAPAIGAMTTARALLSSKRALGLCMMSTAMQAEVDADESSPLATTIPANATESVSKDVAPFLTKHIPARYAKTSEDQAAEANTRLCYRHRPDIKCRRQADESTMDSLQKQLEKLPPDDQQAITNFWNLFSAAPPTHRNIMLQGILTQCCFPQLSFVSNSLRDLIRIDFLTALPPELSFKILSYLDTASLCKAGQVSHRWRMLANDDVVWHKMCEQHIDRKCDKCGWGLPLLERRATKRQIQLRVLGSSSEVAEATQGTRKLNIHGKRVGCGSGSSPYEVPGSPAKRPCQRLGENDGQDADSYFNQPKKRPWKDIYSERFKVESNWRRGRCTTKIFKGHRNGIICLQFDDSILATGSYDTTIKIWDIETGAELRTLAGHTLGVRALQFDERILASGSMDNTIKIWNYRTGECISTLPGHTAGVISLHFHGALLVSGSVDSTIRVWNFQEKSCVVLRGHTDWVNSVKIHTPSKTIFSASDDMTVKIWDIDTKACLRTFTGHRGQVQQVLPITFSGWDDLFKDIEEEKEDDVPEPSDVALAAASNTPSPGPSLASPPYQSPTPPPSHTTTSSSLPNPQLHQTEQSRDKSLLPKFMLTAALDSTLKVWNVEKGKCIKTLFGHVEGVWALAADTLRVVSGAQDRMVKVWDIKTGKYERTITGHAAAVTCLALSDSRLVTGSEDCEARMYCFRTAVESTLCSGTASSTSVSTPAQHVTDDTASTADGMIS